MIVKTQTIANVDEKTLALKQILNVKELSAYTGLSVSWIYKLVQQQKIPHSRPNSKVLFFDKERINSWLLSNPVEPLSDIDQLAIEYVANNPMKGGII